MDPAYAQDDEERGGFGRDRTVSDSDEYQRKPSGRVPCRNVCLKPDP